MLPTSKCPDSTAERVLVLLEAVAGASTGLTFSELRARLGDAPSTTLTRALEPLLAHGFLEKARASGRYQRGERLSMMLRAAHGLISLEERAQPLLQELARQTGHSVAYFHWDGAWAYVRVKCEVAESFHYAVLGHRNHQATHTFLRPILAYLPKEVVSDLGVQLPAKVRDSILKDGYDAQVEQLRGKIYRITAPVFAGVEGPITGALGMTSLELDFHPEEHQRLVNHVITCAARVSEQFSYLPTH